MRENQSSSIINMIYNIISDLLKKWQIILMISVISALVFDTYKTITYTPIYCSEATFAVKTADGSDDAKKGLGETFTYIFSSNIFKKQIAESMGVKTLDGTFKASIIGNTNVLKVHADSSSVFTSYEMMLALSQHYSKITNLVVGNANIDVLKGISIRSTPLNQINHKKNLISIGGLTLILSCGIFGLLSMIKDTIQHKNEIERKLNLHLIGSLPKESKIINIKKFIKKKAILVTQYSTSFQYVEAFKRIRSRIERYANKHHAQIFMVTSSLENEGKSSIAVNIALTLAKNHHSVLLIDADVRKPSLHLIFDETDKHLGIEDILIKNKTLKDTIVKMDNYHLDVLFGYGINENIHEILESEAMNNLLLEAKQQYDYIIVDSAPSRYLSDSRILAHMVDALILVVRQNYANVSTIQHTIEKLSLSKCPIMGCIHNYSFSSHLMSGNYYGYRYGYYHHYYSKNKEETHGTKRRESH